MASPTTQPSPTLADSIRHRTADDWWESLGRVPLTRIVFDPPPGAATEEDVLRLDDHEDQICELIDGTLVEKAQGFEESLIAIRIAYLLSNFIIPRKLGIVSGEAGMVRLLAGRVRIPDVAFVSFERLAGRQVTHQRIPSLVPDLAVEVISDSNTAAEMAIKLREYFAAGVRLVWYVDPRTRSVNIHTSVDQMRRLSGDEVLDGAPVLPGFSTPLAAIFDIA
jgi:Uma2 family endonuclease